MRLRMKNFNIMGVHRKIRFLGGGFTKNRYIGRNCLKRGSLDSFRFKGGLGKKEGNGVFEGCLIPQCTLWTREDYSYKISNSTKSREGHKFFI